MAELIFKEECYAIVGAAMEVHRILGCGFLEPIYQEALEIELTARNIPYKSQAELKPREDAQVINYLNPSGLHLGMLLNFGTESLQWRRLINSGQAHPTKIHANSHN